MAVSRNMSTFARKIEYIINMKQLLLTIISFLLPLVANANHVSTVDANYNLDDPEQTYKLTYMVDGAEYKSSDVIVGTPITPEPAPTKEGYTFSGWSEIPEIMPDHDVTVTGTFSINTYTLTYKVDGAVYKTSNIEYGATITAEPAPTKEGYTFSGWSEIPATMPAHDVEVTGTFSANTYTLTYKVDGAVYKTVTIECGASITPEAAPTKEGYTFSGWSEIPTTMPAHDVDVTGTFSINTYTLTYKVDGVVYKTSNIEYGATITAEPAPTKEGYTFSGWSEIPATMPAHDVDVTGTFSANTYTLTYKVDGEVYKTVSIECGASITPEPAPTKEGYTFSGWSEIPTTMPAHDVEVTGTFSINTYTLTYKVDGVVYKTSSIEYGAPITPEADPDPREGYTFSGWSEIPATMPAHDFEVTGTFSANTYTLIYKVDGEVYKTVSIEYGATITPEPAPTKEGYTFSGWSEIPETMPAHDVEVTGTFSINTYTLTYKVDGEVYKEYPIEYGKEITPEAEPTKEGYKFSGWSEIPATMPAHHVEVTGTFTLLDKYKLTYIVDGQEYKSYDLAVGDPITPEAEPTKEGHTFSGWKGLPESLTMPAEDVTVTGAFAYKLTYMLDGEVYGDVEEIEYGTSITCRADPEAREGYTFSGWQGFPETNTMPAEDVEVTGTFTLNQDELKFSVDGMYYIIGEGNTVSVTSREGKYYGNVVIPSEVSNKETTYSVTGIGESAFEGCNEMTSVTIPSSVTKIEKNAFKGCSGLTAINSEITSPFDISSDVFDASITDNVPLYVPLGTKSAYQSAAGWSAFKTIIEQGGVGFDFEVDGFNYRIGENNTVFVIAKTPVYSGKIVIPSEVSYQGTTYSVTGIGESAFSGCSKMTSVTIPSSVTKIEKNAFNDCSSLATVYISDLAAWCNIDFVESSEGTVPYSSNPLNYAHRLYLKGSEIKLLEIPEGVKTIKYAVFEGLSNVTSVTIPNSVTLIGRNAFRGCSGFTSLTIPKNVTSIGTYAFWECSGLTTIESEITSPFTITNVFESSITNSVTLYVPLGTKSAYQSTSGWKAFKNIVEQGGVGFDFEVDGFNYRVGENNTATVIAKTPAYTGKIVIPNKVSYQGTTYSVTGIGEGAFSGCSKMTSVTIPSSVTRIDKDAFKDCSGLASVHITDLTAWCNIDFVEGSGSGVPYSSNPLNYAHHLYLNGSEIKSLEIPQGVKTIKYAVFEGLSSMTSVTFPSSVTLIGRNAFRGCSGLTSLTIPKSVTSIGTYAFWQCSGLTKIESEITSPFKITNVFESSITNSVTLSVPLGTKSAYQSTSGWSAFKKIIERGGVDFEFEVDGIRYRVGENSTVYVIAKTPAYTGKIVIPNQVSNLGITYNVTGIGASAFSGCTGLTSVTVPNSVTKIDKDAFKGCSGLTAVHISDLAAWCNIDFVKGSVVDGSSSTTDPTPNTNPTPSTTDGNINMNVRITNNRSTALTLDGDLQFVLANPDKSGKYHGTNDDGTPYTGTYNRSGHLRFSSSAVTIPAGQSKTFAMNNVELGGRSPLEPSKITWTIETRAPRNVMLYIDGNSSAVLANNMDPNIVFANGGTYDIVIPSGSATRAATGDVTTTVTIVNNSGVSKTFDGRVCFITYGSYDGYTGYFRMKGTCSGASLTIPAGGSQTYTVLFAKDNNQTPSVAAGMHFASQAQRGQFQSNNGYYIGGSCYTCNDFSTSDTFRDGGSYTMTIPANTHEWSSSTSQDDPVSTVDDNPVNISSNPLYYAHHLYLNGTEIKSLEIPQSIKAIKYATFEGCTGITSLTIHNSVNSIGEQAFHGCSGITTLTLPESVKSIGSYAFSGCKLTVINSDILSPSAIPNAFDSNVCGSATLYIHAGTLSAYKSKEGWKNFVNIVEVDDIIEGVEINGVYYDINLTKVKVIVTKAPSSGFYRGEIIIPEEVSYKGKAYRVAEIGSSAFEGCTGITSVTIPDNVVVINDGAFYGCTSLENVILSEELVIIGQGAFSGCSSLVSIKIPSTVRTIKDYAFFGCTNLTTIISEILEPFVISKVFDSSTFRNAVLYVSEGTQQIYDSTKEWNQFYTITEAGAINLSFDLDGISYLIDDFNTVSVIARKTKYSGNVVIPGQATFLGHTYSVLSIGDNAFENCSGLTSVTIPSSVTSLGYKSFYGCTGLTSVKSERTSPFEIDNVFDDTVYDRATLLVPTGSKSEYLATSGWNNFRNIKEVDIIVNQIKINGIYYNLNVTQQLAEVTSVPKSDSKTFAYKGAITIPNEVTYENVAYSVVGIGNGAFEGGSVISSVSIPNSVTTIGDGAFYGCSNLASIMMEDGITSIGEGAFSKCTSLPSITIPSTVTSIGDLAFYGCVSLKKVNVMSEIPPVISSNTFYSYNIMLMVPDESLNKYKKSSDWGKFSVILPYSNKRSIHVSKAGTLSSYISEEEMFLIEELALTGELNGSDIRFIWKMAGLDWKYVEGAGASGYDYSTVPTDGILKVLDISNASIVDGGTWYYVLVSYPPQYISTQTNSIGEYMFYGSKLESVKLPSDVTAIEDFAFSGCSDLYYVSIPSSVTSIGKWAFWKCSSLTSLFIPGNVTSIGEWAFSGCDGLTSIVSDIENPFEINKNVFNTSGKVDLYATATLIVPDGTKSVYQSTAGWNLFKNIVEFKESGIASPKVLDVMIQSMDNQLSITGAAEGNMIKVYSMTGRLVGSAKAGAGTTTISTTLRSGDIGIVRIGNKSVKVMIK